MIACFLHVCLMPAADSNFYFVRCSVDGVDMNDPIYLRKVAAFLTRSSHMVSYMTHYSVFFSQTYCFLSNFTAPALKPVLLNAQRAT